MNDIQVRPPYANELYHHGIKGQKWGVRRYQKPDGTLTKAGEKRYHKRLVEKAVIIGGQSYFANARAEHAKKRYDKMAKRIQTKPTDKNLQKVKERKRVYEALQKEANDWDKLTNKTIREAKSNADKVTKAYGDIKLKKIPEDHIEAGKLYLKRYKKMAYLAGGIAATTQMTADQKVAEYFRENQ